MRRDIRPLIAQDTTGWEGRARAILENTASHNPEIVSPDPTISNPEEWLILEGRTHGNYSYPSLFVSMHRLGVSPEVERVARGIRLQVKNTGNEADGTAYIGNINWEEGIKLNLASGNITLNPRQGLDLMLDLRGAIAGNKIIVSARSNAIRKDRLEQFYNEVWQVRNPGRAEHLDSRFEEVGKAMHRLYDHRLENGNLVSKSGKELLVPHLCADAYMDIDSANHQGLATKKSIKKDLYFWYPRNDAVAGFGAGSGRAVLNCVGNPTGRDPQLGVRAARVAKNIE